MGPFVTGSYADRHNTHRARVHIPSSGLETENGNILLSSLDLVQPSDRGGERSICGRPTFLHSGMECPSRDLC